VPVSEPGSAELLDAHDEGRAVDDTELAVATMWRFFVISGARRGEMLGLRWADLDLDAGAATITNTRVVVVGGIDTKDTKAPNGNRLVRLDATAAAA
jgi:integrase